MKIESSFSPSSIKLSPELEKIFEKSKAQDSKDTAFSDMLQSKIGEVDHLQKNAETQVTDFATGKSRNLHEAVLAMEMADSSLRMLVTVRNKALEAYQEIMKMPI